MALKTYSVFYETIFVTNENNYINYVNDADGASEIQITLDSGNYSLTEILDEIANKMTANSSSVYTCTLDRDTRQITISADGTFDLLLSTGTQSGLAIWDDIGFTQSTDLTGLSTYQGADGASNEYKPQFFLEDYMPAENNKEKISPVVNESASGIIEVVSFGDRQFIDLSFKFVTDLPMDGKLIKNNQNGLAQFRRFMDNCINKGNLEFMPDVDNRSTYYKILLEKTGSSQTGTGYKLKELFEAGSDIYELNNVKFRVVS